jgi:DnaK suppressor protein
VAPVVRREVITVAKAKARASKKRPAKRTAVKKKTAKKTAAKTAKKKVAKKPAAKKKTVKKKPSTAKKAISKKKAKAVKKRMTKKKVTKKTVKKKLAKKSAAKKKPTTKKAAKKTVAKKKVAKKSTAKKPKEPATTQKTAAAPKRKKKPGATIAKAKVVEKLDAGLMQPKIIRKHVNLDDVTLPAGYTPAPKEEYMGPRQLLYFKQKLENWRQELIVESQETLEHLRTETRDVGDEAERASRESDNILELRTRDRYRKLLNKIDEALNRVDDGTYGFCEETGEEIGLGRLEARPIATLTVDAQERREIFQKQFRDDR